MGLPPGTLVTSFNPTGGSSSSAMQVRFPHFPFPRYRGADVCARSYRQANNSNWRRITCTVMRIACYMEIITPARMLSIELLGRSTRSTWSFNLLLLLLAPHPMSLLIAPCFFFIHLMRKPTCLRPISRPQH